MEIGDDSVYEAKRWRSKEVQKQRSREKAYTEITEDAEFAEKRKAGRVELVGEVLESLTPEGVRYR